QLADAALRGQRLQHELDRSSAGQAELARILCGNAIGDRLRALDVRTLAARTLDDVVFDAAARHRADDMTVVAYGELRARRPRRAAPGFDDRDEQHAPAACQPFGALAQDFE